MTIRKIPNNVMNGQIRIPAPGLQIGGSLPTTKEKYKQGPSPKDYKSYRSHQGPNGEHLALEMYIAFWKSPFCSGPALHRCIGLQIVCVRVGLATLTPLRKSVSLETSLLAWALAALFAGCATPQYAPIRIGNNCDFDARWFDGGVVFPPDRPPIINDLRQVGLGENERRMRCVVEAYDAGVDIHELHFRVDSTSTPTFVLATYGGRLVSGDYDPWARKPGGKRCGDLEPVAAGRLVTAEGLSEDNRVEGAPVYVPAFLEYADKGRVIRVYGGLNRQGDVVRDRCLAMMRAVDDPLLEMFE